MKVSEFDYSLPKNLIAQEPVSPRDHSRLLIFSRDGDKIEHKRFDNIVDYFNRGDVLVLNDSKVFPARLRGKKNTGGKLEVFLLRGTGGANWKCLIGGRAREGMIVTFSKELFGTIKKRYDDGTWLFEFNVVGKDLMKKIEKVGQVPLPPYIKRDGGKRGMDKIRYQTVFANDSHLGSAAAPTAGLHFTSGILNKLKKKGVELVFVTLHVGLGTFAPVKVDRVEKHKIHEEWAEISVNSIKKILKAKEERRRVIAAGTTSVRTIEALMPKRNKKIIKKVSGWVNIFIYPGYRFRIIDGIITNFHLPKSTLIMLVSAFVGHSNTKKIYKQAVNKKYRFFSYGDATFLK